MVPRELLLAGAGTIAVLILALTFMLGRDSVGDGQTPESRSTPPPTVAAAQAAEPASTSTPRPTETPHTPAKASNKAEFSNCLAKTYRNLTFAYGRDSYATTSSNNRVGVRDLLEEFQHDYIGWHCRETAPPPSRTTSPPHSCIPTEIGRFYRQHGETLGRAMAGQYALAVCRPGPD